MVEEADDKWIAGLKASLPPGEHLWGEPIEAELRLADDDWCHGAMGVGTEQIYFAGSDEARFLRPTCVEPVVAVVNRAEHDPYIQFSFGPSPHIYRAATTDVDRLTASISQALELTLVELSSERWAIRTYPTYTGSTQRAAYINATREGTEILWWVDSHVALREGEAPFIEGPWDSPAMAFEHFRQWRDGLLANRAG